MKNIDLLLIELLSEREHLISIKIPDKLSEKRKLLRILSNIRPAKPISNNLLKLQDRELKTQLKEKGIILIENIPQSYKNSKIKLWLGDITRLKVDTIVNAANDKMLGCFNPLHDCIDNAIHSAAGIQLRLECNEIMIKQGYPELTGNAKITKGYNLPATYIIHTVGPIIKQNKLSKNDCKALESCYVECLKLADQKKLKSIAFCCISTGEYGFPNQKAAEIAIKSVDKYFEKNNQSSISNIIFNVFKEFDFEIYNQILTNE